MIELRRIWQQYDGHLILGLAALLLLVGGLWDRREEAGGESEVTAVANSLPTATLAPLATTPLATPEAPKYSSCSFPARHC